MRIDRKIPQREMFQIPKEGVTAMNEVRLKGCVSRDPELRYTPTGKSVLSMSVATEDSYEGKTFTDFHRVTAWEQVAEIGAQLKKGDAVKVFGKLKTRKWTDKSGKTNYITEVVASAIAADKDAAPAVEQKQTERDDLPF